MDEELIADLYGVQGGMSAPTDLGEMQILFRMSSDLLSIIGFDNRFQLVNPAWQEALGYTRAELLATPFPDLVHPDDRETTRIVAERLKSGGGRLISFQNRYRRKDGSYRSLQWRAIVSIEKARYYCVTHDVSRRQGAHETASQLAAILDASGDAIIIQSADGTITSWNPAAERLFGYTTAEAVGRPAGILFAAGESADFLQLLRQRDSVDRLGTVLYRKDGGEVRVALSVSPFGDGTGHITGAVALTRAM